MKQQIEMAIKAFDNKVNGSETSFTYSIVDEYKLQEGETLYIFEGIDDKGVIIRSSAIEYPSGVVMLQDDWQNDYPKGPWEIEDYDWVTVDGEQTVMFDGLPRIFG